MASMRRSCRSTGKNANPPNYDPPPNNPWV
jgi:hypothetical protein